MAGCRSLPAIPTDPSDRIGFVGGYDSNGAPAQIDAPHDVIVNEVRRCLDTYGKYHKGYCFFGFRYANSLDPAVQAASMGEIVETCMQYSFELLMQGK